MMPKGLPLKDEPGLDLTETLKGKVGNDGDRTYWGGAVYWFCIDYEIRKLHTIKKAWRNILTGILEAGGDGRSHWPVEKLFRVSKKILGSDLLKQEYEKWALNRLPRLQRGLLE